MAQQSTRNLAAVPTDAGVPTTSSPAEVPAPPRDAHGFDPTEFEWRPVPRRPRRDGWTPEAQQCFIEALARTGVVERACAEVDMSVTSAYKLRNSANLASTFEPDTPRDPLSDYTYWAEAEARRRQAEEEAADEDDLGLEEDDDEEDDDEQAST